MLTLRESGAPRASCREFHATLTDTMHDSGRGFAVHIFPVLVRIMDVIQTDGGIMG
jgi:hypothetical protein